MQLSAQTIKALCQGKNPMISPFSDQKNIVRGKSWGLGPASYDLRIAHTLVLGPDPGQLLRNLILEHPSGMRALEEFQAIIWNSKPSFALAHTIESFDMPDNVAGKLCDKSTYARVFVSAFNTLFDPGFRGNGTLELVNQSGQTIEIFEGDPVCQMVFEYLDKPTDRPYRGKFQNQPSRPVGPRYEFDDGTFTE
jgi:dCTP deaminase